VANLLSKVAQTALSSFVEGGSSCAVGGFHREDKLSSMERYSMAPDSWSEVLGGELDTARDCLGARVVRLEMDFLDSFITRAKSEGL
jgi:hypothetical protein